MKKLMSLIMCVAMVTAYFTALQVCAESSGSVVVWSADTYMESGDDLQNLVDAAPDTTAQSMNLQAFTTWRIFLDMAPDGGQVQPYNGIRISFASYNAETINIYTANAVYNGRFQADPPVQSGLSDIGFNRYSSPVARVSFEAPYRVSLPGTEYPEEVTFSFDNSTDRFICVEISTAQDSTQEGAEAFGINNILGEITVTDSVPASISLEPTEGSLSIPSAIMGDKTLQFTASVLDEDGYPVQDAQLAAYEFGLEQDYQGVSISSGGLLTVSNGATPGNVIVYAALTAQDYQYIRTTATVTLTETDEMENMVAQASQALEFSMISDQEIDRVGRNLSLIHSENGVLTLGEQSYPGVEITWSSSNPEVITDDGVVTRPEESNAIVTLRAQLSGMTAAGEVCTAEKEFQITVMRIGEIVDMVNLMLGGYGWVTSGWGTPNSAIDGNMKSAWDLGGHSNGSIEAGFRTGSGEMEKFNKVVLYFNLPENMASYAVTGYENTDSDPGQGGSYRFENTSGAISVGSYDESNPDTHPSGDNNQVVIKMKKSAEAKYFGIRLTNIGSYNNSFGVNEFEVYYCTPNDVAFADENVVVYAATGDTAFENVLPQMIVYDETGEELVAEFESSIHLAEDYPGVSLEDGKLYITKDCNETQISLIYRSWDEDKVWLEKELSIPVKRATQDYYDMVAVSEYLDTIIPEKADQDLNLITEYNGTAISWSSNNEAVISSQGKLTRPSYQEKDVTVTLTAQLIKGEYQMTKTMTVEVIREMTDQQRAMEDLNRIDLGISDAVNADLTLPTEGYYGSRISWSSSEPSIISDSGDYNRVTASSERKLVVLTATAEYGTGSMTKEFSLYAETIKAQSSSGGGGGGGGRPSGSSGSTIVAGTTVGNNANAQPLTPEQLEQGKFEDVPQDHWAKDAIEALAERKIISGVDESHFQPERTITREEFVKMIVSAFGITLKPGDTSFTDVQTGEWYEDYVVSAYKAGIISGVSDTEFGIGQNITREDMAVIMERVLTMQGVDFLGTSKEFTDASDISDYAATAVDNLAKIEIFSGDENGNFLPQSYATRAEAAKVLNAAMEKGGIS